MNPKQGQLTPRPAANTTAPSVAQNVTSQMPTSPFADIIQLAGFGQPGTFFTNRNPLIDNALGINIGDPSMYASSFRGADPIQQEAQAYLWSLFGYDPNLIRAKMNFYTPGFRAGSRPTLSF
jgi:hypothetical protein